MKGGKKMGKQTAIIVMMGVLLLGAIGYIGYIQYGKWQESKQMTAYATFQQGAEYGLTQTVGNLVNQVSQCPQEGVPVYYQNVTLHVIAIECYQQPAAPQQEE